MPLIVLLPVHILAGVVSVAAGAAALSLRKGAKGHRRTGSVFTVAMTVMAVTAAMLGRDFGNILAGGLTIYMVGTGWMAARRREGERGRFELAAFVVAMLCALGMGGSILLLAISGRPAANPFILPMGLFLSAGLALAAAGDLSVVLRRGLSGPQRIARHLWRMCFGLLIAVGSFAAQGADALPAALRGPVVLFGAMGLVLALMLYWLARVLLRPRGRTRPVVEAAA